MHEARPVSVSAMTFQGTNIAAKGKACESWNEAPGERPRKKDLPASRTPAT